MANINSLICQIDDNVLRKRIGEELERINQRKSFGLVYEQHLPECIPMFSKRVEAGSIVALRKKIVEELYFVIRLDDNVAFCLSKVSGKECEHNIENLVVVAQFGEPVFPTLEPIDKVINTEDNKVWNTVIEAENYHALQLLEYLYPQKVDCIYIDPPYNTGAKDWKYNNDYVDSNDCYRHSKWLSFMEHRLKIAKKLLNPEDSVLIVAIDDNELYRLGLLLEEIFKGCDRQIINITINPKGKARTGRVSQVDEYLLVIYIGNAQAQEIETESINSEIRWPYLRRSDVESARGTTKGGVKQFYPIYVDDESKKIIAIGDYLTPEQNLEEVPTIANTTPVFPIRDDGKHMNWGLTAESLNTALKKGYVRVTKGNNPYQPYNFQYVTGPSIKKVENGEYEIIGIREDGTKIVAKIGGVSKRSTTVWNKNLYDANAYGSQLLSSFIGDTKFPFPKSLYSIFDVLKAYLGHKKQALILDFFAGSGTTMHALNLLNKEDGGNRRCIMVTNNEISESEVKELTQKGLRYGDEEWEKRGICQSATWPRTKYSILGKNFQGEEITGEYYTHLFSQVKVSRNIVQLTFVDNNMLNTNAKMKQFVLLLGKDRLPQSLVKKDTKYIVSEKHSVSILFNDSYKEEWLERLEGQNHIRDFYIISKNDELFKTIQSEIYEILGEYISYTNIKIPFAEGFAANAEYFKIKFLDKNSIALGRQFKEILPLLWLKAGAYGERPVCEGELPHMYIPANSNFAVLLKEAYFAEFSKNVRENDNIEHVYLVTDSDEAFAEMASQLSVDNVIQLYRDYLENFVINSRRR